MFIFIAGEHFAAKSPPTFISQEQAENFSSSLLFQRDSPKGVLVHTSLKFDHLIKRYLLTPELDKTSSIFSSLAANAF